MPVAALLAAVGLGILSLTAPADSRIAVPALGAVLLVATFALGRYRHEPRVSDFLLALMLLGLGLRFLTLALIYQTTGPMVFAPDAGTYQNEGLRLAHFWSGTAPSPAGDGALVGYAHLNAVLFWILGDARAAPNVLNAFFGVWIALPMYYLARRLVPASGKVARWVSGLSVLFPSLILWSVLNIREAPTLLAIVVAVYFMDRLRDSVAVSHLVGLGLALAALGASRQYMMALVGLSAGAGLLLGRTERPVRSMVTGALVMGSIILGIQAAGLGGPLLDQPSLETLETYRQDLAWGAGSSYGEGYDVSTPVGAMTFLPVGLVYFLFAPFPWSVTSFLQVITLPEMLVWYALFPFGLWGLFLAVRHRPRSVSVVIFVMVAVTVSYALVEGNVGTAYRHRAQILPLVFIFCAVGLSDAYALRARRREEKARRRKDAQERLMARRSGPS